MCYGRGNCDGGCEDEWDVPRCARCGDEIADADDNCLCPKCDSLDEEADAMPFDEAWPSRPVGV